MGAVLVTGGTGTLGRAVVARLRDGGHQVRVASRRPGAARVVVDLCSGAGVDGAVAGVDAIVHCATTDGAADVPLTRTLVDGARRAGTPHLVFVSIVGVDRIPLGYYRAKLAAERVVEESELGWTVLRATQFHDLIAWLWRV
ncbi:MAG: NAD(P)H-binding protein, partial [Actinomycetota bacterium]|nr:NAD(P)H-binding protein [Actinomycetota bacterium]